MRKLSSTLVPAGQIDVEDRTYAVSPRWFPVGKLQRSVQAIGLMVPLRLEKGESSKLRVVSGFRRLKVAQELGIEELPCIILPSEKQCETFIEVLWENLGCRTFSEIEKAITIYKLKHQFGFSRTEIIKGFLPLLELRADRYHLERYLTIARFSEIIQQSVATGGLYIETALGLSGWNREEQVFFTGLVSKYQLGKNKQKELFEVLQDLRGIMQTEAPAIWDKGGLREIDEDVQLSPQDRFSRIKGILRGLRYPRLALHEERYRVLKSSLQLPSGVRINVPPYFEGSQVSITIEAASSGELRDLVGESQRLLDCKELDQIFELI